MTKRNNVHAYKQLEVDVPETRSEIAHTLLSKFLTKNNSYPPPQNTGWIAENVNELHTQYALHFLILLHKFHRKNLLCLVSDL